jgi:hypothetical protein
MFYKKQGGPPDRPFSHAEGCKILAADPTVQIEWSEIERGYWQAVCVCGKQYFYAPPAGDRVRLDPLDPKTSRHLGQCEFAAETDPATLRLLLRVTDKDDYWWVQCASCETGWQVPRYAESVAAR